MTQTKTKPCESCGRSFAFTRATARYCSDTCRQRACRTRHAKPATLKRLETSQRWHDRPQVRRQRHGGVENSSIFEEFREGNSSDHVVIEANGTRTVLGSRYGITHRGRKVARHVEESARNTAKEALRHLTQDPWSRWGRLYAEAVDDLLWACIPLSREPEFQEISVERAMESWCDKYLSHHELSLPNRYQLANQVVGEYIEITEGPDWRRRMELATVAAQNEEILAKIERLRETQTEILERVVETVERVREHFPNDAEVSAAVDRFLEDIS